MNTGDRISWQGANRVETGVIEQVASIRTKDGVRVQYEVAMDNGKHMIVNERSILEEL